MPKATGIVLAGLSAAAVVATFAYVRAEPVKACERAIQATLLSPGSYERVRVERPMQTQSRMIDVVITYDAKNGFGTPLRGEWRCTYQTNGFRAYTGFPINSGPTLADTLMHLNRERAARGEPPIIPTPAP